jgi:hypothetical protein
MPLFDDVDTSIDDAKRIHRNSVEKLIARSQALLRRYND